MMQRYTFIFGTINIKNHRQVLNGENITSSIAGTAKQRNGSSIPWIQHGRF